METSLEKNSKTLVLTLFFFVIFLNLCEGDINTESPLSSSSSKASIFSVRLRRIVIGVLFGCLTGLFTAILFSFSIRYVIRYMNITPILKGPVIFSPKIASSTLQFALSNENQLLGFNPNGKYYRTVLDNGLTVAVKRLDPFHENGGSQEKKSTKRRIQRELEMLAGSRHRNLMSLRAYVRESGRFTLVYDYVPNGSLEDAMNRVRENQLQLNWEARHRIAIGVIKGLQYLHFNCSPRILHYSLKPSNVMLDGEFEPRLGDCGLAHLLPNWGRTASCYTAPECFQNCRYTEKSDIFSFGLILAVLLTGKNPLDTFFGDSSRGGSLGRWLRNLQQAGEAKEALDKSILGEEVEEDEMLMAVRIAVVCLSDLPADRPSSDELVPMLTQLHSF